MGCSHWRSLVGCHICKGDRLSLKIYIGDRFLVIIKAIASWLLCL
ncbi:hypothetical protein [Pseudanabaena sp. UWO310]|nr:hypothetical protein [Pseudanabaena sp. UWO310]